MKLTTCRAKVLVKKKISNRIFARAKAVCKCCWNYTKASNCQRKDEPMLKTRRENKFVLGEIYFPKGNISPKFIKPMKKLGSKVSWSLVYIISPKHKLFPSFYRKSSKLRPKSYWLSVYDLYFPYIVKWSSF